MSNITTIQKTMTSTELLEIINTARVTAVETERLINGAIRKSSAYADHAAVAAALREYLGKRAA